MRLFIFAALMLMAAPAFAEESADKPYLALVDAAIADPTHGKWCDIRQMYPDTSFYRAFGGLAIDRKTEEAGKKVILDKTPEAAAAFKTFLYNNFGSLGAHRYAEYIYRWNGDLAKEGMEGILPDFGHGIDYINYKVEKAASAALLDCIVKSGDGRSTATPFRVISKEEEQILIDQYFHVTAADLDLKTENDHIYNIIKVEIPGAKEKVDIVFQLDDRMGKATIGGTGTDTDKAYLSLVAKSQENPTTTDWTELRHIYADSSFYKPDSEMLLWPALMAAGDKAVKTPSPENDAAYKLLLTQQYGFFMSHFHALGMCQRSAPAFVDCAKEKAAVKGLLASVAKSGDGKTPATAYQIIDIEEARLLIQEVYKLKQAQHAVVHDQRHTLDVVEYKDADGKPAKLYFNLDASVAN